MRATFTAFIITALTLGGSVAMKSYTMEQGSPQTSPAPKAAARPATAARAGAATPTRAALTDADLTQPVQKNCAVCHNDKSKSQYGNVTLEHFDVAAATKDPELSERMIRKVRAGMMPPPNGTKPPAETLTALAERIENKLDAQAKLNPNPGSRAFQRLNRAEYKA